jgi:WD40 repeat protein
VASEVAERLQQRGYQSLFLDFDPADGIPAGRNWEREIYTRLRACRGVILLCSESSMASDWCFAEITHARALGKQLFPVKIAPCELRPILKDTQVIDLSGDREEGYDRLWRGLLTAGLDPADFFKWDARRPPYPGLVPFAREDAAVYCGRDDDRRRCLDILEQMRRYGGERLLMLVGTSGSGKSSLVRAGVVPRLERMADWQVLPAMRPRARPTEELRRLLADALDEHAAAGDGGDIAAGLATAGDDRGLADALRRMQRTSEHAQRSILLVVDQLEELVTTSDEDAARRFVTLLQGALNDESGRVFCLATLRSDYLATLQGHPLWQHTPFREMSLGPLTPAHFTEIITRPALLAGIELEAGLVETMVRDTGTADALPLLAFTLNRLWREYGGDGKITLEEYRDRIGGLEGSIRHEAEAVLASLNPDPAQLEDVRRAFRGMARIDAQGQYSRRSMHWSELPDSVHPIIEAFVAARLLVSGVDETAAGPGEPSPTARGRTLEVAHEAIFRAWDKLSHWLHEDRSFLLWLQHVTPEAQAWEQHPQDAGLLLRGGPLAEAERWVGQRRDEVADSVRRYVAASGRVARRTRLIWRTLQGSIALGLIAVSWLAYELWEQRAETLKQLVNNYWSIGIAARDAEAEKNPLKAAHYFARVADLATDETERANALIAGAMLGGGLELAGMLALPEVPGGAWSRSDGTLAAVRMGSTAQLFDLETGRLRARTAHRDRVKTAAYTEEGTLVSFSQDGRIHLSGQAGDDRELPHSGVRDITLDQAGDRLLSWGTDGVLRLWNLPEGDEAYRLEARPPIKGARFLESRDGVLLWSDEGEIRLWQPATGGLTSWETDCAIRGVALSVDETRLLSWCEQSLHLHDLQQARELRTWSSPEWVDGATFAPGGAAVISWHHGSGRVRLWHAADGRPLAGDPITHGRALIRAWPTPDGRRLVTSGVDGRVKLWDLERAGQLELARATHAADMSPVYSVLSDDGTRTLSWSQDAGARLWDTSTMTPLSLPMLHGASTSGALFYGNDRGIVTWGGDAMLRIWRRSPARELTAPATVARAEQTEPAPSACQTTELEQVARPALEQRLETLGLSGFRAIARCDDSLLIAAGPEAGVVTLNADATQGPPQMRLGEEISGGMLAANGRVMLWGIASLRLWDGATGRPLSARLTSDVFSPHVKRLADGLLTWDAQTARFWRWPAPSVTGPNAEQWLKTLSGARLDAEDLSYTVMGHADWCALARGTVDEPLGCGP